MHWTEIVRGATGVLNHRIVDVAGTPVSLATVLTVLVLIILSFWFSRVVQRGIDSAANRRKIVDHSGLSAVKRLLHYLIVVVGFGVALSTVGIDLGALFTAGAIFAVGIGFAMQTLAQNFVSGVILLLERTIREGDVLEVDTEVVRVEEMGIRSTVVRTRDGEDLIVPNSNLVQATIKNFTMGDRLVRLRVPVGVSYGSDMDHVQEVLRTTGGKFMDRATERDPEVFLIGFGNSSVDWELRIWVDEPWRIQRIRADLHKVVWDAFAEANITIAFPQLDLHVDGQLIQAIVGTDP